ncbi:MAG: DsbA family protein [Bacteroidetes bacterium]|nr:DsbA family protein [Bacteroidota bacterium]MCL5026088.1 DsbA family protein [Chloroflexota bacterium]
MYLKTGKVRFEYKYFPVLGPESASAAQAAECAAEANKFWPYHDKLYDNQQAPGGFSRANLLKYAGQVGLDGQAFAACLDSGKTAAKVNADMEEGKKLGFKGVPTLVINGRVTEGLAPLDVYKRIIDEELQK